MIKYGLYLFFYRKVVRGIKRRNKRDCMQQRSPESWKSSWTIWIKKKICQMQPLKHYFMSFVYGQKTRWMRILVIRSEQSGVKPFPLTFFKSTLLTLWQYCNDRCTVHNSDKLGLLAVEGSILKLRKDLMITDTQTLKLQSKIKQMMWNQPIWGNIISFVISSTNYCFTLYKVVTISKNKQTNKENSVISPIQKPNIS